MRISLPRPADSLLATICFLALLGHALIRSGGAGGFDAASIPLGLAATVPLLWRRQAPIAVLLACVPGLLAFVAVVGPGEVPSLIAMVPLYTVAVCGDRRRSLIVAAISAVCLGGVIWVLASGDEVPQKALWLLLILSALGIGEIVRTRRDLRAAQLARAEQLEREREQEGRRRITAERIRIARELHDSLGHALVAINVRAGVARHLGGDGTAGSALRDIEGVSSEALGDLRATIGLLRENGEAPPTRPSEALEGVPELIENLRAGGIEAEARIDLGSTEIPRSLAQAAYRIVQESFTNVLRHADADRATLDLRVVARRLEIEVTDDGGAVGVGTPGHGLQGMAERAEALGGHVEAGPGAGGWRVHAELPLDQTSPA
ncbi:MAG: sensor histidine kinase [Solirubrobacterales bacterium]